jgi:hypothetical protein
MKTGFSILYLIFSSAMMAQSVHLTVPAVDSSNNAVTIGMAYFTWGSFTDNNGVTVQAGQLTRPVTSGTIDVTLTASDNAGYVYTLLFMHGSTADTFQWRVPAAGATTMAELNQPPSTAGDGTVVHTDRINTYAAGKKQTFSSSATTAGESFSGVASDPSAVVAGDRWFRADSKHMRIYDGATSQTVMYQSDTLPANQLTNPTAATSLLFAANPFNVTFGNTTGSGNMMTATDTASNTGTGYVFTAGTASGSSANPFQVLCGGVQCVGTTGSTYMTRFGDATDSVTLGRYPFGSFGAIYFNAASPGPTNYSFLGYSVDSFFNAPDALGTLHFRAGNGPDFITLNSTGAFFWIGKAAISPNGSAMVAGLQTATTNKTTNYTATSDDFSISCDATAGAVTITLPAAPKTGEWKGLKKLDSSGNTCTYSGNGKNIEGAATLVYSTQYQHAMVQYDGAQWWLY